MKVSSRSAIHELQDCFECTDWSVFNDGNSLSEFTDTVTESINFCEDACVSTKTVTQYGNTKQWFNKNVRRKIVDKDLAHRSKDTDPDAYRKAKSDLKKGIRDAKRSFKTRIEKFATRRLQRNLGKYEPHYTIQGSQSVRPIQMMPPCQTN